MIYTLIHGRDPIPWRITYIEFRSAVKINIHQFLEEHHPIPFVFIAKYVFFHSSPRDCSSKTRCNTLSMLKSQLSLCGTGLNHRRLQQSMFLSKTWKDLFSWIKMDSRKYSMYVLFFPIPEDVFILCIGVFTDSGRCCWDRNYRFCILCIPSRLYNILYVLTSFCTYLYNLKGKAF